MAWINIYEVLNNYLTNDKKVSDENLPVLFDKIRKKEHLIQGIQKKYRS